MSVSWTEIAAAQLQAIRDYLARSSPGYAQGLAGRVVARTEALDGQPLFGAEVPEYGDPAVREVFEHPYRIMYRVDGHDVLDGASLVMKAGSNDGSLLRH